MFHKITAIDNLARFERSEACGSNVFLKWNVVFADNGRGKSTLTAVFRSVGENQPQHMLARKTLGQNNSPKVSLLFDKATGGGTEVASFNGSIWDKNPCKILVFDQDFIDANVHFGGRVDYAQKRGLYEVFVGRQTGTLVTEIGEKDEAIRNLNPKINELNARILGHITSELGVKQFIALTKVDNIDKTVDDLYKQLRTLQNKTTVLKAAAQQKLEYSEPDLKELDEMLKTNIKTLSEEVTAEIKAQLAKIGQPDAEAWIERGHQLALHTSGDCPYCGQSIEPSVLASKYTEYFNKEYAQALKALHDFRTNVLDSLNVGSLVTLGRLIAENDTRYKYWTDLSVKGLQSANFEIDGLQTVLTELSSQLEAVLNKKLQDPLAAVEQPQQLSESIDRLTARLSDLKVYNEIIVANNLAISAFKADLMKSDDVVAVTSKLNAAKDQRIRHTTAVNKLCNDYITMSAEKKALETAKGLLREQLDNASDELIAQHQDSINDCLRKSGASFTLQRIDRDHVGGKPNSTFVLEINGEEITADAAVEDAPNLKTVLSAGDKTTLAFAFFVSHVVQDANLSETLLVIDDPISSLDAGRRSNTLNTIFGLFQLSAQGILLSHDPDFLHGIWQKMGASPTERAAFQVKRIGARASKIDKWDVEKQAESEQKVRVQTMQHFIDNGLKSGQQLQDIVCLIRPTLEHTYKAAYPKEFPSADSLGMFVGHVTASTEPYLATIKSRLPRIIAINDFVTPYSSHDGYGSVPDLNDTEVNTHTKDALALLRS